MRILSRSIFREIGVGALLGGVLFTFVLFLRSARPLFEILVRSAAPPGTVAYLFLLTLPEALTFTVPLSVLVGVLLGLGRMSGDGEITAMRAAGVPGRRVTTPVLTFAAVAALLAACCTLWLTPWAIRERYRVLNQVAAAQVTAEIQPRVFDEQFPKRILYVGDVIPGPVTRWRNVLLADVTPPETAAHPLADAPRVTVASQALAIADVARNRIQLALIDGSNYEVEPDFTYNITSFPKMDQVMEAQKPTEIRANKPSIEIDTLPLYRMVYKDPSLDRSRQLEGAVELHQRLALPLACILLPLVGIPLGVSSRKGGKSGAFVVTVALAFLYYMGLISLIGLAKQGALPAWAAVWTPNILFAIAGLALMSRLERPGDRDWIGAARSVLLRHAGKIGARFASSPLFAGRSTGTRFRLLPQIVDTYVLNNFLFYLGVWLVAFVVMIQVFTFFELLSDIVKNHIPMSLVFEYLFFLTPMLVYDTVPLSVLVAVLFTFGVFSRNNEVTAFKACGVSLYRLGVPVLLASAAVAGALFFFDQHWIPEANRRQDALRAVIKGHPPQTYLHPNRKWIYGLGDRIYYYKYFDPSEAVMAGVNVIELDPKTMRLTRHVQAERAHWEASLKKWVFENGWARDISGNQETRVADFRGQTMTFNELTEPPGHFTKEVKQYSQMNTADLRAYIADLQQSGFNTLALQVQYHRKFSVPLFAAIMALIALPFSFMAGNRGTMAGVGVSFAVAIAYFSVNILFEQVGNLGQLPPEVAAWSPGAIFTLAGLYFTARMRS